MKKFLFIGIALAILSSCNSGTKEKESDLLTELDTQLKYFAEKTDHPTDVARTYENGEYRMVSQKDWTCGFPPGTMWQMYELTKDEFWKETALKNTLKLDGVQYRTNTHDLGFMVFCSYGNAYRLTGDEKLKEVILQASESLITRFNENVGCIRSWDHGDWDFPVIIDNMMNLEMLFWASKETGDPKYRDICLKHADTTMKNHYREDNSSWHVVGYNPENGEVVVKQTHQGLNDDSAWGRGQAWGLYGYVVMYRETGDVKYLNHAVKIADYMIPHLPGDKVSYWDYNDPAIPDTHRDVSAASITASALLELGTYEVAKKQQYLDIADEIIASLNSEKYRAKYSENGGFLLMHSVGHKPKNSEIDVPINYADYYYLEALKRQGKIQK